MAADYREAGTRWGRRMWGRGRFDRMTASGQEMGDVFWDLALKAWSVWDRPQLDAKMRSLCMVAGLTSMGRDDELRIHIFGALANGASGDEVLEAIYQMIPYAGIPKCRGAIMVAKKTIADYKPPAD